MDTLEHNQNEPGAMETDQMDHNEISESQNLLMSRGSRKRAARSSLDQSNPTGTRADELSSSLAHIAREEQHARHLAFHAAGVRGSSGEESSSYLSSDRAQHQRVPVVTGSTTATMSSSGEDRYFLSGAVAGPAHEARGEPRPYLGYVLHHHHHHGHHQLGSTERPNYFPHHPTRNEGTDQLVSHPPVVAKLHLPSHEPPIKRRHHWDNSSSEEESSSGSGSETGYAASASTSGQQSSCSSPSVSSEEGSDVPRQKVRFATHYNYKNTGALRRSKSKHITITRKGDSSSSSVLADFGSSCKSDPDGSSPGHGESSNEEAGVHRYAAKRRHHGESTPNGGGRKKRARPDAPRALVDPIATLDRFFGNKILAATERRRQPDHHLFARTGELSKMPPATVQHDIPTGPYSTGTLLNGQPPILALNTDTMAYMVTFLEPPEVQSVLTMPLCKLWTSLFTRQPELWRTLCVMEPFNAGLGEDESDSGGEDNAPSLPFHAGDGMKEFFGRHRLLYSSFIRCTKYLSRIKDDAVHGRPPSLVDYGSVDTSALNVTGNLSLKKFFSKANNASHKKKAPLVVAAAAANATDSAGSSRSSTPNVPLGVTDDASLVEPLMPPSKKAASKVKLGHSALTQRLLGPSQSGEAGHVNLPWSCAIYSIVNWMVAFSNVEGIQTMCLSVFPYILEDEGQRMTAQQAGLTDIVLRGMVLFPDSVRLHTAAFHTIVLLARPIGGKEGMLFHSSMVNSSGIFGGRTRSGRNGIAVMLDSMQRFALEPSLQAMSCWSMVNIALAPSQKTVLVKLGGIGAIASAMLQHPLNAEVQFRSLFALINLVIPSVKPPTDASDDSAGRAQLIRDDASVQAQLGHVNETTEKDILDEHVGQIANLVVLSMRNFCSSESILNRACLVLHNLSLTSEYHETLLLTPNSYQMLEWCLANYRTDQVLQQSAAGTLHRLQTTLATNDQLRAHFAASVRSQQQNSLYHARQEAMQLQNQ